MSSVTRMLRHASEAFAATLLAAMFTAFIWQVFARYILNEPSQWTEEFCVTAWIWAVFWVSSFMLREPDHVRFDILYASVGTGLKRIMALIVALSVVAAFAVSLLPTIDWILFKRIKPTVTLGVTFDKVFAIYAVFAIAMIVKYGIRALRLLMGADPDQLDAPGLSDAGATS